MDWRHHGSFVVKVGLGLPLEGWVEFDKERGKGKNRAPQGHERINGCGMSVRKSGDQQI